LLIWPTSVAARGIIYPAETTGGDQALDNPVQERRDAKTAKRFFKWFLSGLQHELRVIVADNPRSYGVAHFQLIVHVEQRQPLSQ
jgi:putative transposase